MNKKYLFITSLFPIFLVFGLYFYNNQTQENNVVKDALIKNLNWDSSLQKEVPYVTWNNIELYYILDYLSWNNISINLTLLQEEFRISEIFLWEKQLEINKILDFSITENTPLKITWIAKNNSNLWEQNLRNLIKVTSKFEDINENITQEIIENNSITSDTNTEIIEDNSEDEQITVSISENNITEKIEVIPEKIIDNNFSKLQFNTTSFNSNINNLLEISWENIDQIKFLNIWSYSFTPTFKDENAYFLINKNTFDSGNYFVFIQPLQGNIIPLNTQIKFNFTASDINIANITPQVVNNTKDSYIVLQWNWFSDIISLQLNNNVILEKADFDIINDKVLSVKIEKQLKPGKYHFNIMTTNNIINLDNMNFTITQ